HALIALGFERGGLGIHFSTSAEQRVDLSSNSQYLGHDFSVNSQHIVSALDVEYKLWGQAGPGNASISIFGHASFEYDTLTLSNALFGSNDSFQSFQFMGGLRGRF